MAIVTDLSGNNQGTDRKYNSYNRTNAGEPNGSVTPEFVGEIILDTTNNALWKAMGTANNTWIMLTPI